MLNLKHTIVKTVIISSLIGASVMPAIAAATPAEPAFDTVVLKEKTNFDKKRQKVKTTARKVSRWTDKKVDAVQNSYRAVNRKVETFQDKTLPLGQSIKSAVAPKKIPGMGALRWTTSNTSIPAILFAMLFGCSLAILGMSRTRTYEG